ncbi:uncharacterized protein [Argopecten irradians]|uniref:uncharacterized protein n=1 Tax=Argopecten irradians TaxID=31199 RepID=UPI00371D2DBD
MSTCDSSCRYYDDCCFDANRSDTDTKPALLPDIARTTCKPIYFPKDGSYVLGVFMISTCQKNWRDDNTERKCLQSNSSSLMDMLPVTDVKTLLTYRNRYCATCNEVDEMSLWKLYISCSHDYAVQFVENDSLTETVFDKVNSPECSYMFVSPQEHYARHCHPSFYYGISKHPETSYNDSCPNRDLAPVGAKFEGSAVFHYFRTADCIPQPAELISVSCLRPHNILSLASKLHTISSLIDVSEAFHGTEDSKRCSETEVFLSDQVGCHELHCPFNYRRFHGLCVQSDELTPYILESLFQVNKTVDSGDFLFIVDILMTDVFTRTTSDMFQNLDTKLLQYDIFHGEDDQHMPCSLIKTRIPLNIKTASNNEIQEIGMNLHQSVLQNYSISMQMTGFVQYVADVNRSSCLANGSVTNPRYVFRSFPNWMSLPCAAVRVTHSKDNRSSRTFHTHDGVPVETGFYIGGMNINPVDIVNENGDFYICVETFVVKYQKILGIPENRYVINIVCTCVSIVSLVCCLVHYCVVPLMANQKSVMMIILTCFLLLAHTCLLVTNLVSLGDEVCMWLGTIQHYVWLGSFVFMFLCSFRLNHDIRNLNPNIGSDNDKTTTIQFCVVGFLSTFVSVFSTKIVDVITEPVEPIYGGEACFIADTKVLLFAFVVPVSLILCGNLVLFIVMIYFISHTSSINPNNSKVSNLVLYVKISVSMGFSWILGIAAVVGNVDILLEIFELITNLQGTFLMLSVLWNDRVKSFYVLKLNSTRGTRTNTLPNHHEVYTVPETT